ncbi:MAG: amidohydrolase family protein [Saprospiraceae bacterium]
MQACTEPSKQAATNNQINIQSGTNMAVAISPDKSTLVFDLMGQLWMMPYGGGEAQAITDKFGNARQPNWAPNGQKIAFQAYWTGNWQIYTINKDGSGLQQLTDGPYDHREPVWSVDGQQILYASDETGNYDIWSFDMSSQKTDNLTNAPYNQYAPTINPKGGFAYVDDDPSDSGIKQNTGEGVAILYATEAIPTAPSWNKDGSLISFLTEDGLVFLNPKTKEGNPTILKASEEDLFPFPLQWMDEGNFLYTADGKIKKGNLQGEVPLTIPFEINVSLDRPTYQAKKRLFDAAQELPIKGLFMPRLSPDGKEVALIMLKDLWIRKADGSLQQLTNDPFVEMAPVWSPDQTQLAYTSDRSGQLMIYLRNLETGQESELTTPNSAVSGLAWSPDGQKIAYSISYGPRMGRLFYVSLETGETEAVGGVISSSVGAPSWSPNSEILAVSTLAQYSTRYREGVNGVLYFNIENQKSYRLGGLPHFSIGVRTYNGPEWSPQGDYLAAISASRLWLVPVSEQGQNQGDPIPLTEELADAPSWSADGQKLLYLNNDQLKLIDIESKEIIDLPIEMKRQRVTPSNRKLIQAGYLFDGIQKEWQINQDILIENNRIVQILPRAASNFQLVDTVIDATEQYVMPSLIDGHSHQGSWEGEKLGRTWLAWGVTATRDPASDPYDALNRKEAQEAGRALGPRIFFTGSPFDGSRIYYGGANALQDETQLELELERAKILDYDMIKTYVRLSDPLQKRIVEAAHEIGIPVSSHELYPAATFGIDGMEHILGTSRRGYSPKMTNQNKTYQDVISLIAQSGISFAPTTGIYVSYNYLLAQDPSLLEDPKVKALMPIFNLQSAKQGIDQVKQNPEKWEKDFQNAMQMVKSVHDQGGWVVAGTDSPIIPYGFSLHLEVQAYAAAGIDPFSVLQTATINAAKVLQAEEDLGSVEVGKLADLIILNADPTDDLKNLMQIDQVCINGEMITIESLLKAN